MANCPRCGTADFYPSFSGKGECVTRACSLYVAPKLPELTPDLSGPQPEASELGWDLHALAQSGWTHPNRSIHPTTSVPGPVPYVSGPSLNQLVAAVIAVNDIIPLHDYRTNAIGFVDTLWHHGRARTNNNGNLSPMLADITVGQVTIRALVDPAFIDLTLI